MNPSSDKDRDYNSISPSARALLLMKGHTGIPFAHEAAALISRPETYTPDFSRTDFPFWARVTHFEMRYQSIDQLISSAMPVGNMLELSSGFSFRGLDAVQQRAVHYIDTDLPELITRKRDMIAALQPEDASPIGKLETLPLNALDEAAFHSIIDQFADGPIGIINEGLMMYLGIEEKKQLCALIRETLEARGGYWITADIYLRNPQANATLDFKDELQEFLDRHNIEENKFDSMEAAEAFFKEAGFIIEEEAQPDYAALSSMPYLMQSISPEQQQALSSTGRIQATWRLRAADQDV